MTSHVTTATRFVRRHPKATGNAVLLVARHWRGTANAVGVTRKTTRQGKKAVEKGRVVVTNVAEPDLRNDLQSAFAELASALDRSRRIGVEKALSDKEVSKKLTKAGHHATSVWDRLGSLQEDTSKQKHRHVLRWTLLCTVMLVVGIREALKQRPSF